MSPKYKIASLDLGNRRGPQIKTTEELRELLIDEHLNQNISVKFICQRHSLPDSTVREIVKRFKNEKRIAYKSRGGSRAAKLGANHANRIIELTDSEDENDILSLKQIREQLKHDFPEDFRSEISPISCHAISKYLNENILISMKRTIPQPPSTVNPSTIVALSTILTSFQQIPSLQPSLSLQSSFNQDKNEYISRLKSVGASYYQNCVFVGEANYSAYMLPASTRSRKGKGDQPLKKTRRAVGFTVFTAFDFNGILLLQTNMEKVGSKDTIIVNFLKELLTLLDLDTKIIMRDDIFNRTSILSNSNFKCIFLPSSLPMLDPTELLFSKLPTFVKREPLANDERLLDRVALVKNNISKDYCELWIKKCMALLS